MRKKLVIIGAVAGVTVIGLAVAGIIFLFFLNPTAPYVVKPKSVSRAPQGANAGHSINTNTRTLSVLSSNIVSVIADPGASFQYEVLWLIEKPRGDKQGDLLEYKFDLPKYAMAEHINGPGSKMPPQIQTVADGGAWR